MTIFGQAQPIDVLRAAYRDMDAHWAALVARVPDPAVVCQPGCAACCHETGTRMLDPDTHTWMTVDEHPTARERETSGIEVRLWGLPFPEIVTPDHRYWSKRHAPGALKHLPGKRFMRPTVDQLPGWTFATDLDKYCWIGADIDQRQDRSWLPGWLDDPEWWWLIGYWWGDGWLDTRRDHVLMTIARTDPETLHRLSTFVEKYRFPQWLRPQGGGGCLRFGFSHPLLASFLDKWYLPTDKRSQKCPPVEVEQLPYEYQAELLRGYIAADGHITPGQRVQIDSVSWQGLLAARRILARLGIAASIVPTSRAGTMLIQGRTVNVQQAYKLSFRAGASRLGYPLEKEDPRRLERATVENGVLWTRVQSVKNTGRQHRFIAVNTSTETYETVFGTSHNCSYLVDTLTAEGAVLAEAIEHAEPGLRTHTLDRLLVWERDFTRFRRRYAEPARDDERAHLRWRLRWQVRKVACPLLDLDTNRCSQYDARPSACRAHHACVLPGDFPPDVRRAPQACVTTEDDLRRVRPAPLLQLGSEPLIEVFSRMAVDAISDTGTEARVYVLPIVTLFEGRRLFGWPSPLSPISSTRAAPTAHSRTRASRRPPEKDRVA